MTNVDQFESLFRSASRDPFKYREPKIRRVMVVSDKTGGRLDLFGETGKSFLRVVSNREHVEWVVVGGDRFQSASDLLFVAKEVKPDLIYTYRNLHSDAWKYPYSLGEHLDVLTQVTTVPVIVVPHPDSDYAAKHAVRNTNQVMALTNHLAGDHLLVNYAAWMTEADGVLHLAHFEDDVEFDRTIEAISRIPEIETDLAREKLRDRILKDPRDYIESCRSVLSEMGAAFNVSSNVRFGHTLSECRKLIDDKAVDLLVMHTKDRDQQAMHGLAHSIAIELRNIAVMLV
jgi:hypothetical protein